MAHDPKLTDDLNGADLGSAEGITPLLVVKSTRRTVWPWIWLAVLLVGLSIFIWLIYQVSQTYSAGQATLDPDRPTVADNSPITDSSPAQLPNSPAPDATTAPDELPADELPADELPADELPADDRPDDDRPAANQPADATSERQTAADVQQTEPQQTELQQTEPPQQETPEDGARVNDNRGNETQGNETQGNEPQRNEPQGDGGPDESPTGGSVSDKSPPPPFTASREDDQRSREEVRRIVEQVRRALSTQDLMAAERQLTGLSQLSLSPEEKLLAERLRTARFHLQRFWQGVERGRQKLRIDDRLTLDRKPERIVQLDTSSVRLQSEDGTERTLPFGLHMYDPHLVAAVARRDLQSQGAPFLLALATFWASDRTGDPRMARAIFQAAEQQGLPVGSLGREANWVTAADTQATDTRLPVPPRAALTEARQQVKTSYGSRFAQLDPAGQLQLAQEMLDAAALPNQPEAQRYAMLEQVVKIGCHLGSVDKAFAAVDAITERFAVPVTPLTYAQTWERAYAKAADDNGRRTAISQAVRMSENLLARQQPTVALALIETAQAKLLTVPDDGLLVQLNQLRQQAKANQAKTPTPAKQKDN